MLQVQGLSYRAGKRRILDEVSFASRAGELLVILGNNGAGKSTLLKAITGDIKPLSGEILLNGKHTHQYKTNELATFRGVLRQFTSVHLPFTVREIVMMGRYPHFGSSPGVKDIDIVKQAMDRTRISAFAERNYLTLSGGEQQRVQLARVLSQVWPDAQKQQYLFLDEPVNSLDVSQQHHTLQLAKELAHKGNCVIAVLHDLNLAALYADRILLLKEGKVKAIGTPAEVMTDALLTDTFDFPAFVGQHPYHACPIVHFGAGKPRASSYSLNHLSTDYANKHATIETSMGSAQN